MCHIKKILKGVALFEIRPNVGSSTIKFQELIFPTLDAPDSAVTENVDRTRGPLRRGRAYGRQGCVFGLSLGSVYSIQVLVILSGKQLILVWTNSAKIMQPSLP